MIRLLIDIYILMIIADAVTSYFPKVRHNVWVLRLKKIVDFSCGPIRRYMPNDLPIDPSPLIVIILLQLVKALW